MKSKKLLSIIFGSILLLTIFYLLFIQSKKIEAIKAIKKDYTEKILVSGVVVGNENSILSSEINGTIEKIYFQEGESTKKGDLILKFNSKDIEANVKQKEAELLNIQVELEKLETVLLANANLLFSNSNIEYNNALNEFQKYSNLYNKGYVNILELNEKRNSLAEKEVKVKNALNDLNSIKNGPNRKLILANLKSKNEELEFEKEKLKKYSVIIPYNSYIRRKDKKFGFIVLLVWSEREYSVSPLLEERRQIVLTPCCDAGPFDQTYKHSKDKMCLCVCTYVLYVR